MIKVKLSTEPCSKNTKLWIYERVPLCNKAAQCKPTQWLSILKLILLARNCDHEWVVNSFLLFIFYKCVSSGFGSSRLLPLVLKIKSLRFSTFETKKYNFGMIRVGPFEKIDLFIIFCSSATTVRARLEYPYIIQSDVGFPSIVFGSSYESAKGL